MQLPSFTTLLSAVFVAFLLHSMWAMTVLFRAPPCEDDEPCIPSFLSKKRNLQILVYQSEKAGMEDDYQLPLLQDKLNYTELCEWKFNLSVPQNVWEDGDLFLHIVVVREDRKVWHWNEAKKEKKGSYVGVKMTEMQYPSVSSYNLLGGEADTKKKMGKGGNARRSEEKKVNHIKKKFAVNMMLEEFPLPEFSLPSEIGIRVSPDNEYLPVLKYDFLGTKLNDFEEVKPGTTSTEVTFIYSPVSFGKMRFRIHVEASLYALQTFGLTDKDLQEVKTIFADTNLYLLCITMFISSLHLLFDFLSFKNDVAFWRVRSSLTGLSVRVILWRTFSQTVVFLYLLDENSSFLVLVPSGISTLLELWKAQKVVSIVVVRKSWGPCIELKMRGTSEEEQLTQELDAEAMRYISYLLYPLCVIGAIYSLVYEPHKSWYSWSVRSLVNGVYAFGFLFMLPQLFINYRLKSVDHLPWRSFMYKAFITFVDDLFAYIVTMPTAHRVACFRDDIIFIIYVYQRWLYPVDKSRLNELEPIEDSQPAQENKKEN